jgi:hypothetical protein
MVKQRNQAASKNKARQQVNVIVKKPRKPKKYILQPTNPNQMRFGSMSNDLSGHLQSLQASAATGMSMSSMTGTTGNFYLDALVNPYPGPIRIPDEYSRPTAVHQSFAHQDITTDDNGEVCIILNPKWGDNATDDYRKRWLSVIQPKVGATQPHLYTADPDYATFVTAGIVDGSRPTSSALLVTFVGDTLSDGGQISACWVPGDIASATVNSFYTIATGRSTLALQPGAYSGALRQGAYTYWKPDDIEDYQFLQQADQLSHNYPVLVVCIKSTQVNKVVARAAVVTNYEFTTDKRVCETYSGFVEPDLVLHAKKILSKFPSSCANDDHITLWQKIQQGCKDFFLTVGQSFRNLFAPSLADINRNAAGISATADLVKSLYSPLGSAAASVAASS